MPKRPNFNPVQRADGQWMVSIPPRMTSEGRRIRRIFADEKKAIRFGVQVRKEYDDGRRGHGITSNLAEDAVRAMRLCEPLGISLLDAVKMAVEQLKDSPSRELFGVRLKRACEQSEGRWSAVYLRQMLKLKSKLPQWFLENPCGIINRPMIEKALREGGSNAQSTIDTRSRHVLAALNYRPRHRREKVPDIMTIPEAAAMLRACKTPAQRRAVALLVWGGVRPDGEDGELSRLRWEAVTHAGIYISHGDSKTSTDRIIPMTPRLARLLRGHPKTGKVRPANWKREITRIRKAAGVLGKPDVTRHTFASFYLAACGEEMAKNAMGHTEGSRTLFRHYRRAVSPEAGRKFFGWPAAGGPVGVVGSDAGHRAALVPVPGRAAG